MVTGTPGSNKKALLGRLEILKCRLRRERGGGGREILRQVEEKVQWANKKGGERLKKIEGRVERAIGGRCNYRETPGRKEHLI